MKPGQITAIAREYAEEMCAHMEDDFIKDEAIRDNELTFKMAVNHLLQRFCIVEKDAVRKEYHEIKLALGDGGRSEREDDINMEKEALLKSLFPEIAKEMEDA